MEIFYLAYRTKNCGIFLLSIFQRFKKRSQINKRGLLILYKLQSDGENRLQKLKSKVKSRVLSFCNRVHFVRHVFALKPDMEAV